MADVQHIRLRRPDPDPKPKQPPRHTGILQDQLRRAARRPWNPSFSLAVRILLLVRFTGAMYSNIDDCDEGAWRNTRSIGLILIQTSLQLLGTPTFLRSWVRVPDMGSFSSVCRPELGVHTPAHPTCKAFKTSADR